MDTTPPEAQGNPAANQTSPGAQQVSAAEVANTAEQARAFLLMHGFIKERMSEKIEGNVQDFAKKYNLIPMEDKPQPNPDINPEQTEPEKPTNITLIEPNRPKPSPIIVP